jgi:hypothetical protein
MKIMGRAGIASCITALSTNLGAPARRLLNKQASAEIVIDLHQTRLLTNLSRLPRVNEMIR